MLWIRRFNGTGNYYDFATSLGLSEDNNQLYVTGLSVGTGSGEDYASLAYDVPTGTRLWMHRYNGPGNDNDDANAVSVSPDGSVVVVTGTSLKSGHDWDYATVAYSAR